LSFEDFSLLISASSSLQLILNLKIRNTTAAKSKLILAGFVVLRIFLHKIIMNAKEALYILEEKKTPE
jgi:hypothetical protein